MNFTVYAKFFFLLKSMLSNEIHSANLGDDKYES